MNDLTNIPKNLNAPRAKFEAERHTDKKAYQVRQQEDKEAKLALEDFKRHYREEQLLEVNYREEEQDAIRRER